MSRDKKLDKSHQTELRESELDLIKNMFENASVPMCILEGPDHRLRYMNQSFRRIYGNRSFSPGTPVRDILTAFKDRDEKTGNRLNMLDHVYATGEPFISNEFKTSFDPKGTGELEEGYFNLICQPIENADGEVYGLFITGYEVTENVEARQEIAEQERRLKIALEGAHIGFWEVDAKNNTFDSISDQFKVHFGRSPDKPFTYKDFVDAIHPNDRSYVMDELKEAVETGRLYEIEYRVFWPDGSLHWILVRGQIIHDEKGNPDRRIGISIDITSHKQAEQKLKEAVRLRDNFLSIASHELQTPVTSMKVQAELFERQLREAGNQAYVEQAGKISNQIDQFSKLTGNLLDISRMQEGHLQLEKEVFPIQKLIKEIVDSLQHTSRHNIEVRGDGEQSVCADRFRIGQVLMNLLENAIKYSPETGKIIVRYAREADKVVVSVVDFGIGISKEDQQKVFQRFYKGQKNKKDTYPGFGIGLYISLQIIERHGGGIWVEDNEGEGSIFSFSLPLADAEHDFNKFA